MSACRRFEEEGLAAIEHGLPLDEHFRACDDCRQAREAHVWLQDEVRRLPDEEPPAGWQDRVRARLSPARGRHLWWSPLAVATAALGIMAVGLSTLRPTAPAGLVVQVQEASGHRGGETGPTLRPAESVAGMVPLGSRLVVTATPGTARFAEVRVYRNDNEVVLQATLVGGAAEPRAVLLMDAVGRYRAVLFLSPAPLPPSSGSLDRDHAVRPSGAELRLGTEILVR